MKQKQIMRVLAGEQSATWEQALGGTLTQAKAMAKALCVTQRAVAEAWHKRQDRSERDKATAVAPCTARWRQKQVRGAYARCQYRRATRSHVLRVRVGEPGVHSTSGQARPSEVGLPNAYAKRGYWVATSEHVVEYPADWLRRVKVRDAAVVDGCMTLDLSPEPEPGTRCYAAVWVEQGRGTALKTVRGWLEQTSTGWAHRRSLRGSKAA